MANFRFNSRQVRRAGLPTTAYAQALKALWDDARSPKDLSRVFGREVVAYLEQAGYIALQHGAYYLTLEGVRVLLQCGYPPEAYSKA